MLTRGMLSSAICSIVVAGSALTQAPSRAGTTSESRVRLNFDGGKLKDYVAAVRRQLPHANIVIDGVGDVAVPEAPLPTVSLPEALQWVVTTVDARRNGVILQPSRLGRDSGDVYVFTRAQAAVPAPQVAEETFVKTYYQEELETRPNAPELARAAVVRTIERRHPLAKDAVVYDRETRLLTVTGTRSDIMLADQVVDQMTRSTRVAAALPQLQTQVNELRARVDTLRAQLAEMRRSAPK